MKSKFNAYKVNVGSKESGSDYSGLGTKADTAFDSRLLFSPRTLPRNQDREWTGNSVEGLPMMRMLAIGAIFVLLALNLSSAPALKSEPVWTASGVGAYSLAFADVNKDGYADLICGAPFQGAGGKLYAFYGGPTGFPAMPSWSIEHPIAASALGYSVAGAGDVNQDGFEDIIAGAPYYSNGMGAAYLFHGGPAGLPSFYTVDLYGQAGWNFGTAVSGAGDVNKDGYADVVVGAPTAKTTNYITLSATTGTARLYYGGPTGIVANQQFWTPNEPSWNNNAQFGRSVAGAGDVNKDGYADIAIGAPGDARVQLFYGGPQGPPKMPNASLFGPNGSGFGQSVAAAGDVDADGHADVVVGAPYAANGGQVLLFRGAAQGIATEASWTGQVGKPNAFFGYCVRGAGDLNLDGLSDIVVGAYGYSDPKQLEGAAFVFHGSKSTGLSSAAAWSVEGDEAQAQMGFSVAGGRDVNKDGIPEIAVGSLAVSGKGSLFSSEWTPVTFAYMPMASWNFDTGTYANQGWEVQSTDALVIWNADPSPAAVGDGASYFSPPNSLNYNNATNYRSGTATNSGTATSPEIDLTDENSPRMTFWCNFQTEPSPSFDMRILQISQDNFASTNYVFQATLAMTDANPKIGNCSTPGTWHKHTVDLDPSWGKIRIRVKFDTVDGILNEFAGWFVDNVVIESLKPVVAGSFEDEGAENGSKGGCGGSIAGLGWTHSRSVVPCLSGLMLILLVVVRRSCGYNLVQRS